MIKLRIPSNLTWLGCVGVLIVALILSLGINALVTLGVHFVLPQFSYPIEFVATYIVAFFLTLLGNAIRGDK